MVDVTFERKENSAVLKIVFSDNTGLIMYIERNSPKAQVSEMCRICYTQLEKQINPVPPKYHKFEMLKNIFPALKLDGTVKSLAPVFVKMTQEVHGPAANARLKVMGEAINANDFQAAYDAFINFVEWNILDNDGGYADA